jgi:hypothetical protein
MNDVFVTGEWCKVKWSLKIPFTLYWLVWVDIGHFRVLEIVGKYFDIETSKYFFNRPKYSWLAPWGEVRSK